MNMDSEDEMLFVGALFVLGKLKKKKRRPKTVWVSSYLKERDIKGGPEIIEDLKREPSLFINFCRLSCTDFEYLAAKIAPKVQKQDTPFRRPFSVEVRLLLTLRFLATGDSYKSLKYLMRISVSLISEIIPEVCQTLIEVLREYVKMPRTNDEWLEVAKGFQHRWQFPNCLGAIDGKHCVITAPAHSGSGDNYKGTFSIVLLAAVDAEYKFIFAEVGAQGRISDGGIIKQTSLWKGIYDGTLGLPEDKALPGMVKPMPFVFVADEAFALHKHITKPYPKIQEKGSPKRLYNYRLSRARRIVENGFGILSSVFRILRKPINLCPSKASLVVTSCIYLHNFLRSNCSFANTYVPTATFDIENEDQIEEGSWRIDDVENPLQSMLPLNKIGRKSAQKYEEFKQEFATYFSTVGQVPWQTNV